MEPLSLASFTLAGILSSFPAAGEQVSQSVITTHISPAIAGQWEIDLDSEVTMTKQAALKAATKAPMTTEPMITEPKVTANNSEGILEQTEQRIIKVVPSKISASASQPANQCRELYYFAADNEMWAVSGKERTYSRYLITHRDEGLPIIAIKTIYDNNEVDCSGNQIDQTGETMIAFLNHEGNEMQWCADAEGTECYMDFRRVLP